MTFFLKNFLFKIILRILYFDGFKKIVIKLYNLINTSPKYNDFIFNKFSQDILDKYMVLNFDDPKLSKFKDYNKIFLLVDHDMKLKIISKDQTVTDKIFKINSTENLVPSDISRSIFLIGKIQGDKIIEDIKKIHENKGFYKSLPVNKNNLLHDTSKATSYRFTNTKCLNAIKKTFEKKYRISHFDRNLINTHENICEGIELTKNIIGDYIEIGVYMGGSALTALNYMKEINLSRNVYLLDTFNGFNYEESKDSLDIEWYKTHDVFENEIKAKLYLNETLKDFKNYELVTSNICQNDLPEKIKRISLANIDVDMYEPTRDSLLKVSKKMSKDGIIMCEDPVHRGLSGSLYAMEDFLKNTEEGKKYTKIFKKNHYFLIKRI